MSSGRPKLFTDFSDRVRGYFQRISESGPAALEGLYNLAAGRSVRNSVAIMRNQHHAEDPVHAILMGVSNPPRTLDHADGAGKVDVTFRRGADEEETWDGSFVAGEKKRAILFREPFDPFNQGVPSVSKQKKAQLQ